MPNLQPGQKITDLEGVDIGPQGAVVISLVGDDIELFLLDTDEVKNIKLAPDAAIVTDDTDKLPIRDKQYDEDAIGTDEVHDISILPEYWGPRDNNNPSSLTDVTWRPEPYWTRMQHRFWSYPPKVKIEDRKFIMHRGSVYRRIG